MPLLTTCLIITAISCIFMMGFFGGGIYLIKTQDTRTERLEKYNMLREAWEIEEMRPGEIPEKFLIEMNLLRGGRELPERSYVLHWNTFEEEDRIETYAEEPLADYIPVKYEDHNIDLYEPVSADERIRVRIFPSKERIRFPHGKGRTSSRSASSSKLRREDFVESPSDDFEYAPLLQMEVPVYEENNRDPMRKTYDPTPDLTTKTQVMFSRAVGFCLVVDFETGRLYRMENGRGWNSHMSHGCFEGWKPVLYEHETDSSSYSLSQESGSFIIRDYRDPELAALQLSDWTHDFGWTAKSKRWMGYLLIFFSLCPVICVTLCTCGMCAGCRFIYKNFYDKSEKMD